MSRKVKRRNVTKLNVRDFDLAEMARLREFPQDDKPSKKSVIPAKKTHVSIQPRTKNQKQYLNQLMDESNTIIVATGVASSGKTFLPTAYAIKLLKEGKIEKIIITRPTVTVDEDIGFLPGDIDSKMAPYIKPITDILSEYYYAREIKEMLEEGIIEFLPIGFIRGLTFTNAFIIADECQNLTINQAKALLTRIGQGSKMVITGDLKQHDRGVENGLADFIKRMEANNSEHVAIVKFGPEDVQRHPVVRDILKIYGED